MRKILALLLLAIIGITCLMTASPSLATSSENFYRTDKEVFDEWHVCRTRASGRDGFFQISERTFRPIIALESLSENADKAYGLGKQFANKYPDPIQRAEMIFYSVRDKVRYTPDIDQFQFEEFAQNADELATTIKHQGFGRGDCEDSAILLAVLYKGAGYRSAIVLAPGHAAALVYLPEYKKANMLKLGGEAGWLWAEATGRNNRFGWIPDKYKGARLAACEVPDEAITVEKKPSEPEAAVTRTGGNIPLLSSPFVSVIGLMWIISILRRPRRRR